MRSRARATTASSAVAAGANWSTRRCQAFIAASTTSPRTAPEPRPCLAAEDTASGRPQGARRRSAKKLPATKATAVAAQEAARAQDRHRCGALKSARNLMASERRWPHASTTPCRRRSAHGAATPIAQATREAIADGEADINQCPPGGAEGVAAAVALLTGRARSGPRSAVRHRRLPRAMAVIDEAWCIGCTLCLDACPTDAIVGINKRMHTVIEAHCTGCELCIPVCPVDCISLEDETPGRSGWQAWSADAGRRTHVRRYEVARQRRNTRRGRLAETAPEPEAPQDAGRPQALHRRSRAGACPRRLATTPSSHASHDASTPCSSTSSLRSRWP